MSTLNKGKIKEVCEVISGATPSRRIDEHWGGDINWFTPKDLSNLSSKYVNDSPEKISIKGLNSCSARVLPERSLLFTSRAPIGHLAINEKECCTNQGFKSLVPDTRKLNVEYLFYNILYHIPQLRNLGNGATFKELSKRTVEEFEIPLPPLPEQKKIAHILDTADAYRQKTKALIEKYDALTQSLFLDMFGDPVTNPKGWEKVRLGDKFTISSGSTPSRKEESYYNGIIPWVKTGEVNHGRIFHTEETITELALEKSRLKLYPKNSILIAMYGQGITRGKSAILAVDATVNQACAVLPPVEDMNQEYLLNLLAVLYEDLRRLGRGGNQPNLNAGLLKKYRVIIPPLNLQNQFADRVEAIQKQKAKAQESLVKAEELFGRLMQDVFRGS